MRRAQTFFYVCGGILALVIAGQWAHATNIFSGAPVPTEVKTWGAIKASRR